MNFSRKVDAILSATPGLSDAQAIAQAAYELDHPPVNDHGDFWHLSEGEAA